jgi:hypothetical protein
VQQLGEPLLLVIRAFGEEAYLSFFFVPPQRISGLGVGFAATPRRVHNFAFRFLIHSLCLLFVSKSNSGGMPAEISEP